MNLNLPTPTSPRGIASVCHAAVLLTTASVFPIVALLYGYEVPRQSLIFAPAGLLAGWGLHYLGACGATRRKKKRR